MRVCSSQSRLGHGRSYIGSLPLTLRVAKRLKHGVCRGIQCNFSGCYVVVEHTQLRNISIGQYVKVYHLESVRGGRGPGMLQNHR